MERKTFPELKPVGGLPDGFEWQFEDGPDFYVYRAANPNDDTARVGFYFGLHPNVQKRHDAIDVEGHLVNQKVIWSRAVIAQEGSSVYTAQTLLQYQHGEGYLPLYLHVWAYAASDDGLNDIIDGLARMAVELDAERQAKVNVP